jgi:carboxypeptidase family protein
MQATADCTAALGAIRNSAKDAGLNSSPQIGICIAGLFGMHLSAKRHPAGSASTLQGTVTDPSGAVIAGAKVDITGAVSGHKQSAITDCQGSWRNPWRS